MKGSAAGQMDFDSEKMFTQDHNENEDEKRTYFPELD